MFKCPFLEDHPDLFVLLVGLLLLVYLLLYGLYFLILYLLSVYQGGTSSFILVNTSSFSPSHRSVVMLLLVLHCATLLIELAGCCDSRLKK